MPLQPLSDSGRAYIAHETRRIARSLGLTPVNTPVCSPQRARFLIERKPGRVAGVKIGVLSSMSDALGRSEESTPR